MIDALRAAVARGARVLSVCNGAFVLGAAGLLDGRHCTTHWRHAAELAKRYPAAIVNPDVLYVDEDPVITSAGTAAGIDACLHLVRKEQGTRVANGIARRMVVPPHRDGGQAQYVDRPVAVPSCDTLGEVIGWMQRHLGEPVTIRQLAGAGAHVRAHLRPPVRPGDRDHPAALADRPAHPARPGAAGGDRRDRRPDRGPGRVRQRGHAAASLPRLAWHHPAGLPAGVLPGRPRAGRRGPHARTAAGARPTACTRWTAGARWTVPGVRRTPARQPRWTPIRRPCRAATRLSSGTNTVGMAG